VNGSAVIRWAALVVAVIVQQRATDALAISNRPGTFNGPTEAISGCREHLRGSVLGFRMLTVRVHRPQLA
jgi:hypothetical protein